MAGFYGEKPNRVYCTITEKNGRTEFHVNRNRDDVAALKALSRSIPIDSEGHAAFMEQVRFEIENLRLIEI